MPIDPNDSFSQTLDEITHTVYRLGPKNRPGVLLIHELPGMTPRCIDLADLIAQEGFRIYLPLLFGKPGGNSPVKAICVRKEINFFSANGASKLSPWLRALCRRIYEECGGNGVGVIGMCMTGSIVLSVMLEPRVLVPVMSQPALPLPLIFGREEKQAALGVPDQDVLAAQQKATTCPILGYRFVTDTKCPAERFQTLRSKFGANFLGTEIPTGPNNPGNIPNGAHSVLTEYFVNEPNHPTRKALDQILAQFKARL